MGLKAVLRGGRAGIAVDDPVISFDVDPRVCGGERGAIKSVAVEDTAGRALFDI